MEFKRHNMSDNSAIKEGDWLIPSEIETPQGPEAGPILYRIFKRQESLSRSVTVELFVDQLSKVMKDIETRMRTFTSAVSRKVSCCKDRDRRNSEESCNEY
eukprot:TRINITY_DN13333_c0_g1_i1.p5 TRINITY_DN13333_c0_g1~~TRINITY_DN13333_c0_g1_i1.p5  ORF type:complete len:101 (+),score=22.39 TRINITY_DN13333_c0_g1_i1:195-497(+)